MADLLQLRHPGQSNPTIERMKILVLEARGLHLGFLGCYGNEWIATPNLDRLAAEGVVFDRHYHDCPGTSQSRASQLNATTIRLENVAHFGQAALDAHRNAATDIVWIDGPDLAPPWKLPDDLRDVYFDEEEADAEPWLDPPCDVVGELSTAELLELHNTYAAVVTWFDAQLGVLLDGLRAAGELDEILLCIIAIAGLPLGEHGVIGPARAWLHEELVHVPLVIRFPHRKFAGHRISALTQPADLARTIEDFASPARSASQGEPSLACATGSDAARPFACSHLQVGDSVEWALRTPEWAFLLPIRVPDGDAPRGPQLYAKPEDRWEVNDVRQHQLELADEFEQTLRKLMQDSEPRP
jgi:arylsulfatase A-like enzyme